MSSIRNVSGRQGRNLLWQAAGAALVAAAVAGCQPPPPPVAEPVSTRPLLIDEAMDRRDWQQVTLNYPNGDTVAGSTRFWAYRAGDPAPPAWQQIAIGPFLFLAQTAYLPFTYLQEPLLAKRISQGEIFEPTHFGVPPVPEVEPAPPPPPVVREVEVDDRDMVSQPFDDRPRDRSPEMAEPSTDAPSAADEMPNSARSPDAGTQADTATTTPDASGIPADPAPAPEEK